MSTHSDDPDVPLTYASTQATNCAGCGEYKHTPLRIDAMGGYVCLTCIDHKLGVLLGEFGYPALQRLPISEIDQLVNRLSRVPYSWRRFADELQTAVAKAWGVDLPAPSADISAAPAEGGPT